MKATLYLRIASILTLLHAVMHTAGGVFGKPAPGLAAMVAETMQANRFPVFGITRSYADFYRGMGLGVTISLTVFAVLLWQLGSLVKTETVRLRPILMVLLLAFLGFAVNSQLYFFPAPVLVELLISLSLAMAIWSAKSPVGLPTAAATHV